MPAVWVVANNNPAGPIPNLYQGVPVSSDPLSFDAYNGAPDSYAAATGSTGQIDTWLISPELVLTNCDTFSFYARQQGYDGPDNVNGYATPCRPA